MVSEEDEVSLIVEGHDPSTLKVWVMWEEGSKHSAHGVPQAGVKVVQDNLGHVTRQLSSMLWTDITSTSYVTHATYSKPALKSGQVEFWVWTLLAIEVEKFMWPVKNLNQLFLATFTATRAFKSSVKESNLDQINVEVNLWIREHSTEKEVSLEPLQVRQVFDKFLCW